MNKCENISSVEWLEIAQVPEVQDGWGLKGTETSAELSDIIWGAKFADYLTDGPGYSGPLYILQGGDIVPPIVLTRTGGELKAADFN